MMAAGRSSIEVSVMEMERRTIVRNNFDMELFLMERRMRGNSHVRCEVGEKIKITSKSYLSLLNILPCRIKILSTKQTMEMTVNSKYFDNYPYIIPDYPCENKDLIMTVIPNNSYLGELGGDFDGDTVSLRSVFTKEANEEAERLLNSKSNVLDQNGELIRNIGNDALQAIYTLTKE